MKFVLMFAAVMSLLTSHARCRGAEYIVVNNCPKFAIVNNAANVKKSTTCSCSDTGKCLCWRDECRCEACGLGGAAASPKESGFRTTEATPARNAATRQGPAPETGSSEGTPQAATSTNASDAGRGGNINPFTIPGGCASGNCPTATPPRRGLLFWR